MVLKLQYFRQVAGKSYSGIKTSPLKQQSEMYNCSDENSVFFDIFIIYSALNSISFFVIVFKCNIEIDK